MKTASPSLSVAAAVFAAAVFALTAVAQAPQTEPSSPPPETPQGAPMHREMHAPAPTNLQVLPKDLTGQQVHQIMEGWARALGTHCDTCHAPNPNAAVEPGRRPRLDFALDIKPDKNTARLMVKMVHDINTNYIANIKNPDATDASDAKVSCGTCHRGHLSPPAFKPEPEHHEGPPPQGAPAPAPGF